MKTNVITFILSIVLLISCNNKDVEKPFNATNSTYKIQKIDFTESDANQLVTKDNSSIINENELLGVFFKNKLDSIYALAEKIQFKNNHLQLLDANNNILINEEYKLINETSEEIIINIKGQQHTITKEEGLWKLKTKIGAFYIKN